MLFAPARGEREFYIVPLPGISASNSGSGSAFLQCIFNSIMATQREVGDSGLIFSRRFCYSHRKNILTKWSGKLDFLMEFSFPLIPRNSTFQFPIVWNAILNSSFQLSGIGWVILDPKNHSRPPLVCASFGSCHWAIVSIISAIEGGHYEYIEIFGQFYHFFIIPGST